MNYYKKLLCVTLSITLLISMFSFGSMTVSAQPVTQPTQEVVVPQKAQNKIAATSIVAKGANWTYWSDYATAVAADWKTVEKTGTGWVSAPTPIGYGYSASDCTADGISNIATVIGSKDPSTGIHNKSLYLYLQKKVNITSLTGITGFLFTPAIDDFMKLYVNGTLVSDYNYGTINKNTAKSTFIVPKSNFVVGDNIIAVEIKNDTIISSDMYFDMAIETSTQAVETLTYKNLILTPGVNASKLNFAWYTSGTVAAAGAPNCKIMYAKKVDMVGGDTFPADPISTTVTGITKPAISGYCSNKVTINTQPGTEYVYKIGDINGNWSKNFTTTANGGGTNYNAIFVGDPQIGSGGASADEVAWKKTLLQATTRVPDAAFILSAGDQVNTGSNEGEYTSLTAAPQMQQYPFVPSIGNHDVNDPNWEYHYNTPNMTTLGKTGAGGDYYFSSGDSLYIVLNTNDGTNVAQHATAVEQAIASHPTSKWRIVMMHQDIYGSGKQHSLKNVMVSLRKSMSAIFDQNGIDVVLTGHDHTFTRSYMMLQNKAVKDQAADSSGTLISPKGILYMCGNSSTGSKYYDLASVRGTYAASRSQFNVPSYSTIGINGDKFAISTYRTDSNVEYDAFSFKKYPVLADVTAQITKAQAVTQAQVTADQWTALGPAITAAQAINAASTPEQMKTAYFNMYNNMPKETKQDGAKIEKLNVGSYPTSVVMDDKMALTDGWQTTAEERLPQVREDTQAITGTINVHIPTGTNVASLPSPTVVLDENSTQATVTTTGSLGGYNLKYLVKSQRKNFTGANDDCANYSVNYTVKTVTSNNDIISMKIGGQSAEIDAAKSTITYSLPYGTNATALQNVVPVFEASYNSQVTVNGQAVVSGTTTLDFSGGALDFVVTPATGTAKTYRVLVNIIKYNDPKAQDFDDKVGMINNIVDFSIATQAAIYNANLAYTNLTATLKSDPNIIALKTKLDNAKTSFMNLAVLSATNQKESTTFDEPTDVVLIAPDNFDMYYIIGDGTPNLIVPKGTAKTIAITSTTKIRSAVGTLFGQGAVLESIYTLNKKVIPVPNAVIIRGQLPYVIKGYTMRLTSTVLPAGVFQGVSWSSNNLSVATVSGGIVRGINPGTATITAISVNGIRKSVTIVVKSKVTSVKFKAKSYSVKRGKKLKLSSKIKSMVPLPAYRISTKLTWKTAKKKYATVSSSGIVKVNKKAKKKKSVVISVKVGSKVVGKVTIKIK